MILTEANNYWSVLINILLQKYFSTIITTCIIWPEGMDLQLSAATNSSSTVFLNINPRRLNEKVFEQDVYDYTIRDEKDRKNKVFYNDFVKKLIAALEHTHCEGFVAFGEDIPIFAEAFEKASSYSIWRSIYSRFLFFYFQNGNAEEQFFKADLFKNQSNILVIEADCPNSPIFVLKTNKFVGSRLEQPERLIKLSTFYGHNLSFEPEVEFNSEQKLTNLQGREVILGAFNYPPFMAVDFKRPPLYHDQAVDNPSHLVNVDGTEMRIVYTFCELYNCTLQFDTSEKEEWGLGYDNYSGYGLIGMIVGGRIHMALGGMYTFYSDYATIDMSAYIGRSGVTCLVPASSNRASWTLPLKPFQFSLWMAVVGALCLETLSLIVARKFEETTWHTHKIWWQCFKFGLTTTLKLFVNQTSDYIMRTHTIRMLLFACYVIDIILTSVYGGGLSAVLTLPVVGESPDSVLRLYKYDLNWTGNSMAWIDPIIDVGKDTEPIYHRLAENFHVTSLEDMRSLAKTENMGFVLERLSFGHFGNIEFITPEALQRLKLMVDDIYNQFTVAMVSRLWAHLPLYNDLVLIWHSAGLAKYWEWRKTADLLNIGEQNQIAASKHKILDDGPVKLGIQNFAGLIVIWFLGMTLSVVTFFVEILCFKLQQRMQQKEKFNEVREVQKFQNP